MKIDYDYYNVTSKTVWYTGETEDGKKFTIVANWDQWDDWAADPDDIMWDDKEGTKQQSEEIIEEFLNHMNG